MHPQADGVHILLPERLGIACVGGAPRAVSQCERSAVQRQTIPIGTALAVAEAVKQRVRRGGVVTAPDRDLGIVPRHAGRHELIGRQRLAAVDRLY